MTFSVSIFFNRCFYNFHLHYISFSRFFDFFFFLKNKMTRIYGLVFCFLATLRTGCNCWWDAKSGIQQIPSESCYHSYQFFRLLSREENIHIPERKDFQFHLVYSICLFCLLGIFQSSFCCKQTVILCHLQASERTKVCSTTKSINLVE